LTVFVRQNSLIIVMRRLSFTVRDRLAGDITSGAIPAGSRLPPEPQLAAELGVSRATLREALRSLEEDGFVSRTRGAGTYATHRPRARNNLDVNFGVTEAIRAAGMEPGTISAEVRSERATSDEAAALDLAPGDAVTVLERVRTADGRPVVYSRDVVAASLLGVEPLERLGGRSVYEVLDSSASVVVQHGIVVLEPRTADRELARRLGVKAGALLLYLRQVDYDGAGNPILLSDEYHRADAFEFSVVRRGPGRTSG
jgi:GntR family transcriptional regulator